MGKFGMKSMGKFARCMWRVFLTACAISMTVVACVLLYVCYCEFERNHKQLFCSIPDCYYTDKLSTDVRVHDHREGRGKVINIRTGKVSVRDLHWYKKPVGKQDSLAVYSNGKLRGYFNMYTGEVVLPAKYEHAWIFSDGVACVEQGGVMRFIDTQGKQLFDRTFPYKPNHPGMVFHGDYCAIDSDNDGAFGLMNRAGEMILPEQYSELSYDTGIWILQQGNMTEVVDKDLCTILPPFEGTARECLGEIIVTLPDHSRNKYTLEGELIGVGYISEFDYLEYDEGEYTMVRARLCKYTVGRYCGLMTLEGKVVTPPIYEEVEAISKDSYLVTDKNGDKRVMTF